MLNREVVRLSLESLNANRFRTALTMLGMVIGVLSIVLLVSIGNGAKRYILSEFEGLGTNLIIVQPGKSDRKGMFQAPVGAAQRKMTMADVLALEKRASHLDAVTGLVFGTASAKFEESTANVNVFGANDSFVKILNLRVAEGAFYTREEDEYGRRVVVLGARITGNMFGSGNPLGQTIKINENQFKIVGVLAPTGDKLGFNFDDFVYMPTHAALRLFNDDKLFGIRARARSRASLSLAVDEITEILRERRDGEEDFTVLTQKAVMQSMETILSMLTWVLGGIAAISMLVAGIGIMNIMLVSVAERTEEIGIRRAVGARQGDILRQFLAESVMLSTIAGSSGILASLLITEAAHLVVPSFDLTPPLWILLPSFLLSLAVGVVFGVWPARKASKIEPLDALRYE